MRAWCNAAEQLEDNDKSGRDGEAPDAEAPARRDDRHSSRSRVDQSYYVVHVHVQGWALRDDLIAAARFTRASKAGLRLTAHGPSMC